jgi:hypothetical protein
MLDFPAENNAHVLNTAILSDFDAISPLKRPNQLMMFR